MDPAKKLAALPPDWHDDLKMTVMFSPFRDKNLNPKSWDQKVKFWSDVIIEQCKQSGESLIDMQGLRATFRRNEKSPTCLETVLQEMMKKGQVRKLSEMGDSGSSGWLSWGYDRLVKKPVTWSWKWLSQQQETAQPTDTYVVLDVIKKKADDLLERERRLCQTQCSPLVEYDVLQGRHTDLCTSAGEFDLVLSDLAARGLVTVQQQGTGLKMVKFAEKETKNKEISEQDLHIHRIQKAHDECRGKIEILMDEVKKLAGEAIAYKQKGMTKLAMSCMRKRRLALLRIDKLTGAMETLDEILHRIHDAESNEMVLKAIEGGSRVLQGLNARTTADDVTSVMDNLADVTQSQDEILAELSTAGFPDEPSQEELEEELSIILHDDTPPRQPATPHRRKENAPWQQDTPPRSRPIADSELERELDEILDDKSGGMEELNDLLDNLNLPDVPTASPGRKPRDQTLLTS